MLKNEVVFGSKMVGKIETRAAEGEEGKITVNLKYDLGYVLRIGDENPENGTINIVMSPDKDDSRIEINKTVPVAQMVGVSEGVYIGVFDIRGYEQNRRAELFPIELNPFEELIEKTTIVCGEEKAKTYLETRVRAMEDCFDKLGGIARIR